MRFLKPLAFGIMFSMTVSNYSFADDSLAVSEDTISPALRGEGNSVDAKKSAIELAKCAGFFSALYAYFDDDDYEAGFRYSNYADWNLFAAEYVWSKHGTKTDEFIDKSFEMEEFWNEPVWRAFDEDTWEENKVKLARRDKILTYQSTCEARSPQIDSTAKRALSKGFFQDE